MQAYGVAWVATALVFLGLDAVWLSFTASRLYRPLLGGLLRDGFLLAPAVLFYLIYTIGIVVFAILPEIDLGPLGCRRASRRVPRPVRLRRLRPDQPGDASGLACGCDSGGPGLGDAPDRSRRECGPAGGARSRDSGISRQSFTKPESMRPKTVTSALALKALNRTKAAYSVCE